MDALEDTAFLLSVMPAQSEEPFAASLKALAAIAKSGVAHLVRGVEASSLLPEGQQVDVTEALQSADAVIEVEKKADDALRLAISASLAGERDAKHLMLEFEMRALDREMHRSSGARRAGASRPDHD